jgi:hypothetical protein
MTFKLDEVPADLIAALYNAEATAPKNFRALLTQAAQRLGEYARVCEFAAGEMDTLAAVRTSVMDTTSSTEEKAKMTRATLLELARQLRAVAAPCSPFEATEVI